MKMNVLETKKRLKPSATFCDLLFRNGGQLKSRYSVIGKAQISNLYLQMSRKHQNGQDDSQGPSDEFGMTSSLGTIVP